MERYINRSSQRQNGALGSSKFLVEYNGKSPYTKMYEDEINKFRVERPDLADVDDDDIINEEFGEGDGDDE